MIIKNPTDLELKVQIKGKKYVIPANESLSGVSEEVTKYWKEKLHSFIIISSEAELPKTEDKELPKVELTEEVAEEIVEELVKEVKEVKKVVKKSKK